MLSLIWNRIFFQNENEEIALLFRERLRFEEELIGSRLEQEEEIAQSLKNQIAKLRYMVARYYLILKSHGIVGEEVCE